ncbi:MAG: DEAD/DEAH box helicase [Flavobacteriales bacterium]|nr:DEAD/DEAH box helicase [Flavobacteriales bacterium]
MLTEEKRKLTAIGKVPFFRDIIEKLTLNTRLSDNEVEFILTSGILFLEAYQEDRRRTSYLEFAYYILLKYSLYYGDYKPLYDISVTTGLYPIADFILSKDLLQKDSIENHIIHAGIEKFRHRENYIQTLEQNIKSKDFLEDPTPEKSYLAPTSFGKSSLIVSAIRDIKNHEAKIVIVVPTKSLLMQTYRLIQSSDLHRKIIIHDEMYNEEKGFIAIFTQERALRLINRKQIYFDILFIDEAHNILKSDQRSILLSRLIARNKINNPNHQVIYLSPLIDDPRSLQLDSGQKISTHKIKINIKEPEIYERKIDGQVVKYNRFVNQFYPLYVEKDIYKYILSNALKKNFIYNYRPVKIESFAQEFIKQLPEINNDEINSVIKLLKQEVHAGFYAVKYLKHGVVYIHGKLPDIIKEYLENKFKTIGEIKYIVANSVILEGMNLPIDNLFVLNTRGLNGKELINLIGRVNRLNEVFDTQNNDLKKLEAPAHFINNKPHNGSNNMANKIIKLRNRNFEDKVDNPTLNSFDESSLKDEDKRQKANLIQENERFLLHQEENIENRLEKYLIENGIEEYYSNREQLVSDIDFSMDELLSEVSKMTEWNELNLIQKISKLFIEGKIENIKDFEISRLQHKETQNYYDNFILVNRKKSLNENVIYQVKYFRKKAQSAEPRMYFGSSYGEIGLEDGASQYSYIDLSLKSNDELVNLSIVKLKMEEDFISYKLNKFIVMLFDFNLIDKQEYHLYTYGTVDEEKIALTKYGFGISLINKLHEDEQLRNLFFDEFNNVKANPKFYEYLDKQNDLVQFEIKRFI